MKKTLNILISAFACSPYSGSEGGVGWRWAIELARQHSVTVLTDECRRADIEHFLARTPVPNLEFAYHRPHWLRRLPMNARTAHLLYLAWQFSILGLARQLHAERGFDVVQHLTYGVFRHPSLLGRLGVPFVFGPVGGGETAPGYLERTLPLADRVKERLRRAVNWLATLDPFLNECLRRSDLLLVKTRETALALPRFVQSKAIVDFEIGVEPRPAAGAPLPAPVALRVLYAGRLLGLKGIHLGMRAIAELRRRDVTVEFVIVGDGPMRRPLEKLAKELGIADQVRWYGRIPQAELFALYPTAGCVLFPSLHDSSGNVVLEALSFGVPVVCLDLGGPRELVTPACGMVVPTSGGSVESVVGAMADAVRNVLVEPELRAALSEGAKRRAAQLTWEGQVARCYGRVALLLGDATGRGRVPPEAL